MMTMGSPLFPRLTKVFHRGGSMFFSGYVVATYMSLNGTWKCVVETTDGISYVAEEQLLERLSYPTEKKEIKFSDGGKY